MPRNDIARAIKLGRCSPRRSMPSTFRNSATTAPDAIAFLLTVVAKFPSRALFERLLLMPKLQIAAHHDAALLEFLKLAKRK